MFKPIKYFLWGCVVDVGLLILFMFRINSFQLNKCGRPFAFFFEDDCTFAYFAFYGLYFGGLFLLGAWFITFPALLVAPAVGFMMDVKRAGRA